MEFFHLLSPKNTGETTLNYQRFLLTVKFLIQRHPAAVCSFITAYSPLISSAESKEDSDSSVGIATSLLTGSKRNCVSAPSSDNRLFSVPRKQYQLWGGTSPHSMGTGRPPE